MIELDGVMPNEDILLVNFSAGKHEWQIKCKAKQLQTFAAFQSHVADILGVWIDHDSQDSHRARTCSEDWRDAVRLAWEKGAAK